MASMVKNVLIVDDSAFMRLKLKNILEKNGYSILGEAQNGLEAVEFFQEKHPDLVIMDIAMPHISGIDALKQIVLFDKNAKVIMCCAIGQKSLGRDALDIGAIDFMMKPFNPKRVIQLLNQLSA